MKSKLVILFGIIMLLYIALAFATDPIFKQNEAVDISEPCYEVNDAPCNPSIGCNITVFSPNNTILINAQNTTRQNAFYNYTINNVYTSDVGKYRYDILCYNSTTFGNNVFYFDVTPIGGGETNTFTFLPIAILAIVLLVLAFIFKNHIMSFFAGLGFSVSGIYGMIYGFNNVATLYTRAASLILIGLGLILVIVSGLEFMEEMSGGDKSDGNNDDED